MVCILECEAGSPCNSSEWILCHMELDVHLLRQSFCKSSEEGTAACEVDSVFHDVRVELRRSLLENVEY